MSGDFFLIRHDIIVIGASAGGVQALRKLFRSFGAELPAAVFVVLHLQPHHVSMLPKILQMQTTLPVAHASDGEAIQNGRVYVAPPNRHLLVQSGHLHLGVGPKENRARPAINPLFRSAAQAYGPRVVGVVLTGILDDGTAGLWEIKRRGGLAVVQTPEGAEYGQMPASAIANVDVDYQASVEEMGSLLKSLVDRPVELSKREVERVMPEATRLTCPDCHGPVERFQFDQVTEYRCRVGHSYGPQSMLEAHEDSEERALWSAIESLEEGADLVGELTTNPSVSEKGLKRGAEAKRKLAKVIREAVETSQLKQSAAEDQA